MAMSELIRAKHVTYGNVSGSPKDGLIYEPFTRLEGPLLKNTYEKCHY